jgi:hypothetical protein
VKIPRDPTAAIVLLGKVKKKSDDAGADTPLGKLKWDKIGPALATATANDDAAVDFSKKAEKAYGARDVDMPTVMQALRDARDILLGSNSDNPKALTDWGYEVDDTPPPAAAAKPAK